jgi:hypothetical protein
MKFECSYCGQHLEAEEGQAGVEFECPNCGTTVQVPDLGSSVKTADHSIPKERPNLSHVDPKKTEEQIAELDDKEKLWGLRATLLIMPIYMLSLFVMLIGSIESIGLQNQGIIKLIMKPCLIILAGTSWVSLKCLWWMHEDIFRAVAVGKKIALIFVILSSFFTLAEEWPSDKFEGPISALYRESTTVNYEGQTKNLHLVDLDEVTLMESGFLTWITFVFDFAQNLLEELAIYAFVALLYRKLKKSREEFEWSHFLYESTFGKIGTKYDWDQYSNNKPA